MKAEYQDSIRKMLDSDPVTLTTAGNVTEIMYQSSKSKGNAIRVLDKDSYIYLPLDNYFILIIKINGCRILVKCVGRCGGLLLLSMPILRIRLAAVG